MAKQGQGGNLRKKIKLPSSGASPKKKWPVDPRLLAAVVAVAVSMLLVSRCLKEEPLAPPEASVRSTGTAAVETLDDAPPSSDEEGKETVQEEEVGVATVPSPPPGGVTARFKTPVLRSDPGIEVFIEGVDENGEPIPCQLVWLVNRQPLDDVSGQVLPWAKVKRGDRISLQITPQAGPGQGRTILTDEIVMPNSPPRFISTPRLNLTAHEYVYQAQAEDADSDPLTYTLENGPAGMAIDSATGRLVWRVGQDQSGEQVIKVAVSDPQGGRAVQEYALSVEIK